ncbi:MAG: AMP-binding protein [Bacteroidales bacterium]|nr:AMP-binding protein [Bacteroidales bacterium]
METLVDLFEKNAARYPENPLLWEKENGRYMSTSYSQTKQKVHQFAAGLINLGVKKGDRIALLSENRKDWIISELGILYTGAINVPLSVKLDATTELKFRLSHSGSRMIIVSGNQAWKIDAIKNDLPDLDKIIYLDPREKYGKEELPKEELYNQGVNFLKTKPEDFENTYQSVKPTDYANICYTSGTTADPKGIILSHRNYTVNVEQALSLMDIPEYYKTLLILPLDHSFAHTAGIYSFIASGASMGAVEVGKNKMETLKNIPKNIKELKPNLLLSVPALAKNFRKNIEKGIKEKGPIVEKLFNRALKTAYSYNKEGYNRGKGLQALKTPLLKLYDKLFFSKIREGFGGELDCFIGGGALLDIELQRFFYAIGMPMLQGYGLTETSPCISSNAPQKHKLGSSGFLVKNIDVKICDEKGKEVPLGEKGEIVVKGENVMVGYWKNEKATRESIKDGWFYTGDLGYMDKDGFLYVLGRYKSLLISDDGEKFSPESIEEALIEHSDYIDQCMLHNNQDPYTVVLIVPNKEAVKNYMAEQGLSLQNEEGQNKALELIQGEIDQFKKGGEFEGMFPDRWLPAAIAVLGEGFTEENKMLNSTLKIVRRNIEKYYKDRIDFLYTPEGKNILNHQNKNIIKTFS